MRSLRRRLLATLVVLFACGDDSQGRDLAHEAELVRDLNLINKVPVKHMTREQYRAAADADVAMVTDADLKEYAETYGRLGFFPVTIDLRPTLAGSQSDFAAASYDPTKKDITLVDEPDDDVVVHEWVHALQDQHFHIDMRYPTSDAFLAHRAVVEGDAVLSQIRFLVREQGLELKDVIWSRAFAGYRGFTNGTLADPGYPLFFVAYPTFVYAFGLEYSARNLTGATFETPFPTVSAPYDMRRQDALFGDAGPQTTHDVLAQAPGRAPLTPGLDAVPADLDASYEKVDWDSLGEWYVFLLLSPLEGGTLSIYDSTKSQVTAWRGDRALFVKERGSGAYGVVWASEWDTEANAAWLMDRLATLYAQPAVLERRGTRVVAVVDVAAPAAATFAEAAFATAPRAAKPPAPRSKPSLAELIEGRP